MARNSIVVMLVALALASCANAGPTSQGTAPDHQQTQTPLTLSSPIVAVFVRSNTNWELICTGVATTTSWVLTAAHCVDKHNPSDIAIADPDETTPTPVERIVYPPRGAGTRATADRLDVAALRTPSYIHLTPVDLAPATTSKTDAPVQIQGLESKHTTATPRSAVINTGSRCPSPPPQPSDLCLTAKDRSLRVCPGDSGSAVLTASDTSPQLVGLIARGNTCETELNEAVAVDLTAITPWLRAATHT